MPRKAASPSDTDTVPRRSSRIASIPQPSDTNEVTKAPKKRTAREKGDGESSTKKSKSDQEASELSGVEKQDNIGETSLPADGGDAQVEEATTAADGVAVPEKEDAELNPAAAELNPIDVGDSLPSFILKNEKDEDVDVASLTADKGLILFLVPKADTPGCTTQACGFRDIYPDFTSHNFEVYCLSADTPAAQTKWQSKKNLPYPLLSDRKRVLIAALGAGEGGKTKRSHFIFERGGKLVDKKVPVKPADSPKLALEFIKAHQS